MGENKETSMGPSIKAKIPECRNTVSSQPAGEEKASSLTKLPDLTRCWQTLELKEKRVDCVLSERRSRHNISGLQIETYGKLRRHETVNSRDDSFWWDYSDFSSHLAEHSSGDESNTKPMASTNDEYYQTVKNFLDDFFSESERIELQKPSGHPWSYLQSSKSCDSLVLTRKPFAKKKQQKSSKKSSRFTRWFINPLLSCCCLRQSRADST